MLQFSVFETSRSGSGTSCPVYCGSGEKCRQLIFHTPLASEILEKFQPQSRLLLRERAKFIGQVYTMREYRLSRHFHVVRNILLRPPDSMLIFYKQTGNYRFQMYYLPSAVYL